MTTELPPVDATTKGWWDATRERRLVLQTCQSCGHRQHRPRAICTACGSLDLGWSPALGTGTVLSRTVVHRSPDPDREPGYVVAIVTLFEGPTILTNLVGDDAGAIEIDAVVRVDWQPLADGRHLPVFRRQDSAVPAVVPTVPLRDTQVELPTDVADHLDPDDDGVVSPA